MTYLQEFCKEAVIWKHLHHPNITHFYGINTVLFPLCLVSEWMPLGTVISYLQKQPGSNHIDLVSRTLRWGNAFSDISHSFEALLQDSNICMTSM